MTKTIIFDLGGVILNRGFWIFREYLVKKYDVTNEKTIEIFIKKYYKPYFSGQISEREFWTKSLNDLGIKDDWKTLKKKLLNSFKPNEWMFDLVDKLRKNDYKTVLLSDQTKEWWPILNKKYLISSHFDICIISAEVGINKPDPKIYKMALEKSKTLARNALFVDDLEDNLKPAEELGMKSILFENYEKLKKDLIKIFSMILKIF